MNKTGVVIGRFQVPSLTKGHIHLLSTALSENNTLLVIIGASQAMYSEKHPLDFETRKQMILETFPDAVVLKLDDYYDDVIWSNMLDAILAGYDNVTLYGSRDCFVSGYHGKYPVKIVDEKHNVSGTEIRQSIKKNEYPVNDSKSYRAGIIKASVSKYPVAYPTVDIGLLKEENNTTYILLGRKPNETFWRLPGGFVDPKDQTLEHAAFRELVEEVGNIQVTGGLKYICSHKVNDWRYRGTNDGIMTTLFTCYKLSGKEKASDDLEDIAWFTFEDAEQLIGEFHKPLLHKIKKSL